MKDDQVLRISADFENYKKRSAREINEFKKFANKSLIKELLPVIDNLESALNLSKNDKQVDTNLIEGIDMTLKELFKILKKFNVKPIKSIGKPFDPTFHQAIIQEKTNNYPKNTVIDELQKGYMMYDKLVRPSMVTVSALKQ